MEDPMPTVNLTSTPIVDATPDQAHPYVPIARLYADASGDSHLDTWQWPAVQAEIAPPAPPVLVTTPEATEQTLLLRIPAGWQCRPHPAPHRHLMTILLGTLESTTSDGRTHRFPPGSAVLVEDTTGHGHGIRTVDGDVTVAVTQLGGQPT
jgi:quercetin dioxygenase-like cupin family protein